MAYLATFIGVLMALATELITALPVEHNLKTPDVQEQQRMLQWIAFRQALYNSSRTLAELSTAEVDQLETLIGDAQDRPASWIANTLCFHYDRCRPVHTGGESGSKSLLYSPRQKVPVTPLAMLALKPNPADQWVAVEYKLSSTNGAATLVLKDAVGRQVQERVVVGEQGQVILELTALAKGVYVVELRRQELLLAAEKLVVQ